MQRWFEQRASAVCRRRLGIEPLEDRRQLAADSDRDDQISEPLVRLDLPAPFYRLTGDLSSAADVDMIIVNIAQAMTVDFDIDSEKLGLVGPATYLRLFSQSGRELAAGGRGQGPHDSTVGLDAFLRYTFRDPGRYYLGISTINNTQYDPLTGEGDNTDGIQTFGDYVLRHESVIEDVEVTDAVATTLPYQRPSPPLLGYGYSQAKYGRISSPTDVDIYYMPNVNLRTIDFDIDTSAGGAGSVDTYLRLFDLKGKEIAANDNGLAPGDTVLGKDPYLRYTFINIGPCYLGVSSSSNRNYNLFKPVPSTDEPVNSSGVYKIVMRERSASTEYTSRLQTLDPITTNPLHRSSVISWDAFVDKYVFEAYSGQTIDFDVDTILNGVNGLNSHLRLFDDQGNQLSANDNAASPGETTTNFDAYLRYTFSKTGKYYIVVSNNTNVQYKLSGGDNVAGGANSIGSYRLTIQQPFPNIVDGDDTISEATALDDRRTEGRVISDETDVDMVTYNVLSDGSTVSFISNTFSPSANSSGLRVCLRLFDATGQQLAMRCEASDAKENALFYTFPKAGNYYVGISGFNNRAYDPISGSGDVPDGLNAVGTYNFRIRNYGPDYSDEIREAPLGQIGFKEKFALVLDSDVDLKSFYVTAGQVVDFNVDTSPDDGNRWDPMLRLFASDGTELAANDNAKAIGESELTLDSYLRYSFSLTGYYYIGISFAKNSAYDIRTGGGDVLVTEHTQGLLTWSSSLAKTDTTTPVLALAISAPSVPESSQQVTAVVTRLHSDTTSPLSVLVSTNDAHTATVPETVTIPAGKSSVSFPISVLHDLSRGTRLVTISAIADGYNAIHGLLRVADSDGQTHNKQLPADTNADGLVTAMDALLVINYLNSNTDADIPAVGSLLLDVNADGLWTAMDALLVINHLNSPADPEGESPVPADIEFETPGLVGLPRRQRPGARMFVV